MKICTYVRILILYINLYYILMLTCNGFITAKFEEWRRQLGSYIIDYNSVILEEAIAKGLRMKMTFLVKLRT